MILKFLKVSVAHLSDDELWVIIIHEWTRVENGVGKGNWAQFVALWSFAKLIFIFLQHHASCQNFSSLRDNFPEGNGETQGRMRWHLPHSYFLQHQENTHLWNSAKNVFAALRNCAPAGEEKYLGMKFRKVVMKRGVTNQRNVAPKFLQNLNK